MFVLVTISVVLLHLGESSAQDCGIPKVYSEIGCEAVLGDGDNCPKRFDCDTVMARKGNECYYEGITYNDGDDIPQNLTARACQASCFCRNGTITCAHIECPEVFAPDYKEGCVPQNSMDSCCANDYVCAEEDIEKLPKCYLDDEEYRLGEKMYPDRETCFSCICAEGFDNSTKFADNPHCSAINCGIELHSSNRLRRGCIPIYYKTPTCCPIGWRCPETSDAVIEVEGRTNEDPEDPNMECSFGELKFKIGNKLSTQGGAQMECECSIPPMVTCIQIS